MSGTDEKAQWFSLGSPIGRRSLLRGGVLGGAGLAAAALIGCGDDDDDDDDDGGGGGGTTATPTQAATETATPAVSNIVRGGTHIAAQTTPYRDVFDPHTSLYQGAFFWTYQGNLAVKPSNDATELLPQLVTEWEVPGDGTELTLTVRENVKFHNKPPTNGRLLTADDVAFNMMRIAAKLDPDNAASYQRRSTLPNLDTADAVDDQTVHAQLTAPHSSFLWGLGDWRNSIVPRDFVESGGDFADPVALIGTGPWIMEQYEDGASAHLAPHPDFWEKDANGESMPYLDGVDWVWVPDRVSQATSFINGEIDYFSGPTKAEQQAISAATDNFREENWIFGNWNHFRYNTQRPPFDDPRVRRALFLAFDYKTMNDTYYGEGKWDWTGPLAAAFADGFKGEEISSRPGYNPDTKEQDIAEAQKMLDGAGFPEGEGIDFKIMIFRNVGVYYDNAIRGVDDLKAAFPKIQVEIDVPADTTTFAKRQIQSDFDMVSYTLYPSPDPVIELRNNYYSTGSRNYGDFSDSQIDSLLDQAVGQLDLDERGETLKEVQRLLLDEHVAMIHTGMPRFIVYFLSKVKGMEGFGGAIGGGGYDTIAASRHMWLEK